MTLLFCEFLPPKKNSYSSFHLSSTKLTLYDATNNMCLCQTDHHSAVYILHFYASNGTYCRLRIFRVTIFNVAQIAIV